MILQGCMLRTLAVLIVPQSLAYTFFVRMLECPNHVTQCYDQIRINIDCHYFFSKCWKSSALMHAFGLSGLIWRKREKNVIFIFLLLHDDGNSQSGMLLVMLLHIFQQV